MVDKVLKFIQKSKYREKLLLLLKDLADNNLQKYDIKSLKGLQNTYRIRIGTIRVVFHRLWEKNSIIDIDNRGDMY